jgi:hypothetical protein
MGVQAVARGAGPSLQELNVGDVRQMTNISVQIIADHCTNLTSLSIAGNMQVMDMDVADVCKKCLGMQSLNLRACRRLTDGCLKPISGETQPACTENYFTQWDPFLQAGLLCCTDFNFCWFQRVNSARFEECHFPARVAVSFLTHPFLCSHAEGPAQARDSSTDGA